MLHSSISTWKLKNVKNTQKKRNFEFQILVQLKYYNLQLYYIMKIKKLYSVNKYHYLFNYQVINFAL